MKYLTQYLSLLTLLVSCATVPERILDTVCPTPRVFDFTPEIAWDERDKTTYSDAKLKCALKYGDNSCLVKFYRFKSGDYRATCGERTQACTLAF